MRKLLYILAVSLLCSCEGFLDEVDKDKLIPSKTDHYAALLLKEFSSENSGFRGVDLMADNIEEYSYSKESSRKTDKPTFTWQIEIEIDENGNKLNNNTVWEKTYRKIAITNYVLELIDGALGTQSERDFIKGEAYFDRAWSYFWLVNLYGQPYKESSAISDLGVPIRIGNAIEQIYNRASVKECYDLIESDLLEARRLISQSGLTKSKYHPSVSACDLLLSRVFLYQKKWDKAEEYATNVISNNALSLMIEGSAFVTPDRSDILYSTDLISSPPFGTLHFENGYKVSKSLIGEFDQTNDIRFKAYFTHVVDKIGKVYYAKKQELTFTKMGKSHLRVAEAYLNRAEARFNLGKDAASDMAALVSKRYRSPFSITQAGADLLDFILKERRKELCFEDHHRWFDLRRMDNQPTIVHIFTRTDADGNATVKEKFTLFPGDLNYTLPIPLKERDNNPLIRNNERYDKLPEITNEL